MICETQSAAALAPWEDRANPTRAALGEAVRLGLPAFPCRPDKRPACPRGFKDATSDPEALTQLWRQYPGHLVGVPTGESSGIFVVDVDSAKHVEAQEWLECQSPQLPDTREHRTKSGGLHILFKHRPGLKNTTSRLAKGVDTRGEGGYIIWWPFHLGLSAHNRLVELADVPDWICTALNPPSPRVVELPYRPSFGKAPGEPNNKVQGVLNAVGQAHEGNRNSILYWGACVIRDMFLNREIGNTEGATAFKALEYASLKAGLSAREIQRTI